MDFLTTKRGYCELYASAMAYLVRAAGIPSRVAIGFRNGHPAGDRISVTNHDAHAWVEVYFSGIGWVPFDPTPPGERGGGNDLPWAQSMGRALGWDKTGMDLETNLQAEATVLRRRR